MKSGESGSDNPVNPGKPEGETTTTPTKVTEDMLFTPEYCKYLNNTTYNKMFETLWTDMSDVSRNCKWDDISIAARTVMSDGISGQLKRIGESLVSKAFNKNIQAEKVQSALALDYVNHAKEYSDYCANVYDEATDSLSKSKKVVSLLKKGSGKVGDTLKWVAEDEDIEEFAKAINAIFSYGDDLKVEQDLKKILKSSEVMKKVSSVFKTSGKAISAYQVAVSIEILRITTEDTQKHYMSLVDKDSTVYQGLKINYEKIKRQDAVNFALEMLDTSGITDAIGWITAKVTGAGTTASVTVAVVDLIYTGLNFILKKAGVIDVQDYLKVQYALLDQSWLKLAVSNQRLNIANNVYNTATLKNNYQDAFELYLSCMLQTPGYMEDYSGSDSYYKKLKKDIKKYESKLTYKNYIQSCLQNANASYSYTLSGDKATITKVNPGTGRSARVSSPFALNVMAMENEDSYCLDIPSEVDGYEVEAVNTDLFDNKTEAFAVTIPDTVTTIKEGAFQDCTALKQVFLENGLKTIETNVFAGCEDLSIINVPDTVNTINENAFGDNISIEAAADSQAHNYAEQNGNTFTGREKTVTAISVKKNMDKTEYAMSEPIDLTGLELTVTYVDGTTKDIKEGFTGDFTAKQIGRNEVVLYYNGVKTKTTVQVRSEQCEYTVLYQDTCGEKIHENVTGSGTTGETITLSIPEIAGYTPVETNIKQILGETNVFKVIYSVAKKKDIGEASVSYKKEHTETGQEIRPAVEVRYKGLLLKADTDYELEYNNNIKPGKGNIWIAGIGDYEGVQLCNFVIKQKKTAVVKPGTSNKKIQKITLSAISKQIASGKKVTLKPTVLPANASNKKLTWKSSNTKVATVTQGGVVTLKKNTGGKKVTITATATDGSRKSASWQITSMKGIVKKVKITGSKSVKAGKKLKLKAKVTATKKANTKLRWTSSNTKYATVNAKGIVKTKKTAKGKSVKITAMATDGSGKKQSVKIKIKK
ncbi:bacterial group 2 Ig-like protein [Anaerobutyricum hallii DSM 3353]|uniref:Bacterial group 2 Ig-like protein n=2 Tax=Anaerobutyricum hallii TaxID=39488 RepID=C0EWN4_9FIRM|nr:bacterial group 2 Ig-like protein [Anaerobutyricum hallii DSM 3353]